MQTACRLLSVSESGYYEWRRRPPSARAVRHAWLTEQIRAVHTASHGTYGILPVHAELTLGLGLQVGHNQVELLMTRAGIKGLPGNRRPRPVTRHRRRLIWRSGCSPGRPQTGCGSPTSLSTAPMRASCTARSYSIPFPGVWSGGQLIRVRPLCWSLTHSAWRSPTETAGRCDCPLRPRRAIYLLGLHRPRQAVGSGAVDGLDRRLLRQRNDRILLGQNANRTPRPQAVEDAHRVSQRDLRIPGDLPQPPTASLRPRHAHSDRVRTATPTRGLKPSMTTPSEPGYIISGHDGAVHSLWLLSSFAMRDKALAYS